MIFKVVDINVILSALISRGNSFWTFKLNAEKKKFYFVAPEFILVEAGKHLVEIAKKSTLPFKEIQEDMGFIKEQIHFISEVYYEDKNKEAREILKGHEKDVPYLALALKMECDILSGDKVFKQLCSNRVKNPKEILEELNK